MAFDTIYNAILAQELLPGTLYSEPELAQKLGISRTPVREALLELSSKGFIEFLPRRGFQLTSITPSRMEKLCDFRIMLETGAFRMVLPSITPRDVENLIEILEEDKKHYGDNKYGIMLDRDFHLYFPKLTDNSYVIDTMLEIRNLIDWGAARLLRISSRRQTANDEHSQIINCLLASDYAGALQKLEKHLHISKTLLLDSMRELHG